MSSGWFTTSRARPAYTVAQLGALRDTSSAEIPHGASSKMAPSHKPSRHLACNLCRDRKVKCDGAKPECEKCVKAGETCSYSTTSKASRAELQQTILQLHERIEQTEANQAALIAQQQTFTYYASQNPLSMDSPVRDSLTMLEHHQRLADPAHIHLDLLSNGRSSESSPFGGSTSRPPTNGGGPVAATESLLPFETNRGATVNSLNPLFPQQPLGPSTAELSADSSGSLPASKAHVPPMALDLISSPLVGNEDLNGPNVALLSALGKVDATTGAIDPSTAITPLPPPQPSLPPGLPTLRDVQTWNLQSNTVHPSSNMLIPNPDPAENDDVGRLLEEFICLASVTESAQQNIIGVADTAALYSSYFRQLVSLDGGGNPQNAEELERFLETLEARMREISEIASRDVLGQARRSREAVGSLDAYRVRMKEVEAELRRRAQGKVELFRDRYNLSRPLQDQD